MNARGEISFRRDVQVRDERIFLTIVGESWFPAIETEFADGARLRVERGMQVLQPIRRALVEVPRVITKRGNDFGKLRRESGNSRPIGFTRAVNDHPGHAFSAARGDECVAIF